MVTIGLIDYGAGNLSSVRNALEYLKLNTIMITDPSELEKATHLILPGVGAFAPGMRKLEKLNLVCPLKEHVLVKEKPFLGICLGMQLLASTGHEFEAYPGLGLIEGAVVKLKVESYGLRLPHIGWNRLNRVESSPLFKKIEGTPSFYFLHSFHLEPKKMSSVVATCMYGTEVIAVVAKDNIFGVQFHPEKSQHDGLRVLRNFACV